MRKARRKLKETASKSVKRPKPRRGKARLITRAEARRRAEQYVLKRMFKGATVRDGAQAGGNLYNVRRADTWVVYRKCREMGLRSADVVVVCKRTGRVLYEGSAHDEG